jgi:hypothetical protein
MPRPKNPEGKHVTMSGRFTEAEAAEIDAARGIEDRSVFVRRAVLAAVERQQPPAGSTDRQAEAVKQNHAARLGDCPHPKARINKGLCCACGTYVGNQA